MKKQITNALEEAIKKIGIEADIELTPSKGHGDFSTNVAMKLAGKLKDSPQNIANKIIENINSDIIEKAEVAGPGFINIFMASNFLAKSVENILSQGKDFGRGKQDKFINVEYVSANPTGFLHIGHARGAVLGSVLVKVLEFAGNKVDSEYYINDAGNQINVLAESVRVRYLQELGIEAELPESSYGGADIVFVAKKFVDKYGDALKDETPERFKIEAKDQFLHILQQHLKNYRVEFKYFSSEQSLYDNDQIKPAIDKLKNFTYEKEGALWLKTTDNGDDKDRVLIKSDGAYTYFTPDIAYHDLKLSRGYNEMINIWGADHIGYVKRMSVALEYLGLPSDKLDILTVQLVKLFKDGQELKMSKRMGTSFTIVELLDEVGVDAARWFMIDRSNDSQFVFDINAATSKSNENPVFTVQYTHARANQLIEKSKVDSKPGKYSDKEREIINTLNKFPDLINRIASTHKVHLLPQFLLDLAGEFNSWYSTTKAIGNENEASLIALTKAVKQVLNIGLELLIIDAPNKM